MAVIVVNDPANAPMRITTSQLSKFIKAGVSEAFLDEITSHPHAFCGVKRDRYYIIKTRDNDLLRFNGEYNKPVQLMLLFIKIANRLGFSLIMIKRDL